jgi:hypothetical protein
MFSGADIRNFQDEAARKAKKEKKVPALFTEGENVVSFCKKIPNLGSYIPSGYRAVKIEEEIGHNRCIVDCGEAEGYFVDSSGFGSSNEPALTTDEFFNVLTPGFNYAIIEEGQFQITIGVFKKL